MKAWWTIGINAWSTCGRGQRFRGAIWHHLGWHEAPLTPADLDATFGKPTATRTTCTGGMSIFSFNLLGTYTPGVPYNVSAIKNMAKARMSRPQKCPFVAVIAVEANDYDIFSKAGSLILVSPPEYMHALIFAAAEALGQTTCVKAEVESWKLALTSVTTQVCLLDDDSAKYGMAVDLREVVRDQYEAVYWTALQRVYAIAAFRGQYEAVHGKNTSVQIARLYNERVTQNPKSEGVTGNLVDAAYAIMTKALSHAEVLDAVKRCDGLFGQASPFDMVSKMHGLINKCQSQPHLIKWVFLHCADLFMSGQVKPGHLGYQTLTGYGLAGGHKGLVEVYILKYQIKEYMLNILAVKHQLTNLAIITMRDVLGTHEAYRSKLNPYPVEVVGGTLAQLDWSWQAGWSKSSKMFMELCEEVVYSSSLDGSLKVAVKNRKIAEEVFDYQVFGEKMSEVLDQLKAEKAAELSMQVAEASEAAEADTIREEDGSSGIAATQDTTPKQTQDLSMFTGVS